MKILYSHVGGSLGPRYGSTHFDYRLQNIWDFKVHVKNSSSHSWTIVNDREAVDRCMKDYGALCILLAVGRAEFDDEKGSFKTWHDQLKGRRSTYEIARINRGAPSRRRKSAFNVESFEAIQLDPSSIRQGLENGWMEYFQEGMRNADGSPRRPKYLLDTANLPDNVRLT
ncbi:MAG: hypothetical protein HYU39_03115 [Thaumarchaeota archaeon]|nr:hypothetical protein [Nitrososphaerota archaeon]